MSSKRSNTGADAEAPGRPGVFLSPLPAPDVALRAPRTKLASAGQAPISHVSPAQIAPGQISPSQISPVAVPRRQPSAPGKSVLTSIIARVKPARIDAPARKTTLVPVGGLPQVREAAPEIVEVAAEPPPQLRMPAKIKKRRPPYVSFLLFVALPTLLAAIYYFRYAPDIYVAEFRFAVTETTSVAAGRPSSVTDNSALASSGAAALFGAFSIANVTLQNYVVTDYLTSRRAVEELSKRVNVRAMFDRYKTSLCNQVKEDGTRLGATSNAKDAAWYETVCGAAPAVPLEQFTRVWQSMVTSSYDPVTGIAAARVRAYSPEDAKAIADNLVQLAENLVNEIASRAQKDAVEFARIELARAEDRLNKVRERLYQFRQKEGMIDPTSAGVGTNVDLVKQIRGTLLQQKSELDALRGQRLSETAPAVVALTARIRATETQLASLEKEVRQDAGSRGPLTEVIDKFEALDLERQYSRQLLVNALQAYDNARAIAASQHLYLTPYVRPSLPESAVEPQRAQSVGLAFLGLFGLWIVALMFGRAINDH